MTLQHPFPQKQYFRTFDSEINSRTTKDRTYLPDLIGTLSKKKYEMYFFHFVPNETFSEEKNQYYHWTSYVVKSRKTVDLKRVRISQLSTTSRTAVCLISKR